MLVLQFIGKFLTVNIQLLLLFVCLFVFLLTFHAFTARISLTSTEGKTDSGFARTLQFDYC